MKKYTLILLALFFAIGLFSFNVNSLSAYDSGCTSGGPYSSTTGELCGASPVVECPVGSLFSSTTGERCTAWSGGSSEVQNYAALNDFFRRELSVGSKGNDVKVLQQVLQKDGFLYGNADGSFGILTQNALTRYQTANGIAATGRADFNTLEKIKVRPWSTMCPLINLFGIYTCPPISQEPIITVPIISTNGMKVLSPNGGEAWEKGTTQTISWDDNTSDAACPLETNCLRVKKTYDITLFSWEGSKTPRTIAKNVLGSSYNWTIPSSSNSEIGEGAYTIQVCQTDTNICDSSSSYFKIVGAPTTTTSAPTISSLYPYSGPVGTKVIIYGKGFATGPQATTNSNTKTPIYSGENFVSFGSSQIPGSIMSIDGRSLTFSIPTEMSGSNCTAYACTNSLYASSVKVGPGTYPITVTNGNGTSNQAFFTVTSSVIIETPTTTLPTHTGCSTTTKGGYSSVTGEPC